MANEMLWTTQSGYLTNNKLNKMFQRQAQPLTRFRQFVRFKEAFGKSQGESVNWLKVSNVGTYGGKVAETSTMPETNQPLSWGTLSVYEYIKEFLYSINYAICWKLLRASGAEVATIH